MFLDKNSESQEKDRNDFIMLVKLSQGWLSSGRMRVGHDNFVSIVWF
jgi:hypothetical protein